MRNALSLALLGCLLAASAVDFTPAAAQPLSGSASGGGADQGGSGAPGGGTGIPGAVANGTTKYGIGSNDTHGRRFQHHYGTRHHHRRNAM